MPVNGAILIMLLVLGPVAAGLMLERAGIGRLWSIVGLAAGLVSGVVLVRDAPVLGPRIGVAQDWIADRITMRRPTAGDDIVPQTASPGGAPHDQARGEIDALRRRVLELTAADARRDAAIAALRSELEAETLGHAKTRERLADQQRAPKAAAEPGAPVTTAGLPTDVDLAAVLESERTAHAKTRLALKAVEEQVATLEDSRARLAKELASDDGRRGAAKATADDAQSRLVLAEATIARLEAALRAAAPRSEPTALPDAPAPFASRPATAKVVATVAGVAADQPAAGGEAAARMAKGLATRLFALARIDAAPVVQGKAGGWYRIVCRDPAGGKRLTFESGSYALSGGDGALDACRKAIEQDVLSSLPPTAARRLYVQGFVSPAGFIKPQKMATADAHLRAIDYLPHNKESGTYAPAARRQAVGTTFTNKELPNLRGWHIASSIAKASSGAIRPDVLEGETRPANDEASRSFDLVLHVAW